MSRVLVFWSLFEQRAWYFAAIGHWIAFYCTRHGLPFFDNTNYTNFLNFEVAHHHSAIANSDDRLLSEYYGLSDSQVV